jgi:hypothetical protein
MMLAAVDELPMQRSDPFERAFLIGPHQSRVARHIGGEGGGLDTSLSSTEGIERHYPKPFEVF